MENKIINNKFIITLYERSLIDESDHHLFAETLYNEFINNYDDYGHIYTNILTDKYFKMNDEEKYEIIKKHELIEKYSHLMKKVININSSTLFFYVPKTVIFKIWNKLINVTANSWHQIGRLYELECRDYFLSVIEQPLGPKNGNKLN